MYILGSPEFAVDKILSPVISRAVTFPAKTPLPAAEIVKASTLSAVFVNLNPLPVTPVVACHSPP